MPSSSAMVALPEGLRYFVVRPDKTMTPLVPADQLPFQIPGLPRQLTPQQLSKERWQWVTDTSEPKSQLPVQAPVSWLPATQPSTPPRSLAPDHFVRLGSKASTPVNDKAVTVPSTSPPETAPKTVPAFSRPVVTEAGTQTSLFARPTVSEVRTHSPLSARLTVSEFGIQTKVSRL
jgi:hypothetical protein